MTQPETSSGCLLQEGREVTVGVKVFPDSSVKKEHFNWKGGGHSVSDQQKHRNLIITLRHAWLR